MIIRGSYEGNSELATSGNIQKFKVGVKTSQLQFLYDPHFTVGNKRDLEVLVGNGVLDSINRTAAKIPVSNSARTTFAYAAFKS